MISYDPQKLLEDKRSPLAKWAAKAAKIDYSKMEAMMLQTTYSGRLVDNLMQARTAEDDLLLYGEAFIDATSGKRISPDEVKLTPTGRFSREPDIMQYRVTKAKHYVMPTDDEISKALDGKPDLVARLREIMEARHKETLESFLGVGTLGEPWDPTKYQKD